MSRKNKTLFDFIDFGIEVEKECLARSKVKQDSINASWDRLSFIRRKDAENKGICQSCKEKRDFLRFVLDSDIVMCYDCFYEGMEIDGELYSYHGRAAEDMDGFMYEEDWVYYWEEENPHMVDEYVRKGLI